MSQHPPTCCCDDCDALDALEMALWDATADDEGRVTAKTLIRHLAKEGFQIVKLNSEGK